MVTLTRSFFLTILFALSLSLVACQATVHEKGTLLNPKTVAQIRKGVTTRAQVKDLLGVPTVVNSFRKERWSYVQDRQYKNIQRTFARVINRVEITFDQRGVVQEIQHNFDDELLDPQTLPDASNSQAWFGWLWGGEYGRPATGGRPPEKVTRSDASPEESLLPREESTEQRQEGNPWWRFWSSSKE